MIGAINMNKSPVTLDQVTPLARLQGEYQPALRRRELPEQDGQRPLGLSGNPGSVSWGGFAPSSPDHLLSGLVVKAGGGEVKKMNYVPVGTAGEMLPLVIRSPGASRSRSEPERNSGLLFHGRLARGPQG
jgi:putative tricarboxylic transport membrane protein